MNADYAIPKPSEYRPIPDRIVVFSVTELSFQDITIANFGGMTFPTNAIRHEISDGTTTVNITTDHQEKVNANVDVIPLSGEVDEWQYTQHVTFELFGRTFTVASATIPMTPHKVIPPTLVDDGSSSTGFATVSPGEQITINIGANDTVGDTPIDWSTLSVSSIRSGWTYDQNLGNGSVKVTPPASDTGGVHKIFEYTVADDDLDTGVAASVYVTFPASFYEDGDVTQASISAGVVSDKESGSASNGWLAVTDGSGSIVDGPYDISTGAGIADLQSYVESQGGTWDADSLTWTGAANIPLITVTEEVAGYMPVDSGHRDDIASTSYDSGTKVYTITYDTGFVLEVDVSDMTTKAGAHNPGSLSIGSSGPLFTGSGGWAGEIVSRLTTIPQTAGGVAPNIRINNQFLDFDDQGSLTRSGSAADIDSFADDTNYLIQNGSNPNLFEYTSATDNLNRQFLQACHLTGYEFCTPFTLGSISWNDTSIDSTPDGDFVFDLQPGDLGTGSWDGVNYVFSLFIEYPADVIKLDGSVVEAKGLDGSDLSGSEIASLCYPS